MEASTPMLVPLIGSVGCVKGEIHSVVTAVRLRSRAHTATRFTREALTKDIAKLLHAFRTLHERLEGVYDIREVDCVLYLQPFLEVITSESTSGDITSVALSSLHKFLSYGFLTRDCPRAKEGVNLIAKCIPNCVFEETDSGSDEVVLMKLLELAVLCLSCDASHLLTVSNAWEMYETCYMIGSDRRSSKLMKSKAETVLGQLTLSLFSRANQQHFQMKSKGGPVKAQANNGNNATRAKRASMMGASDVTSLERDQQAAMEYVQSAWDADLLLETGFPAVLARVMSLCSGLMQPDDNSKETVSLALGLVNIALEAGGSALSTLAPVVAFLKGEMCRNLLRTSHSSDLEVLSKSLRVVFNLFSSIKNHMKVQLEVFLTSVHLRMLQSSSASLDQKEVVLESLLEFCREPSLMHDLYINYDCDVRCTSLFDSIMTELCKQATPVRVNAPDSQEKSKPPTDSFLHYEDYLPEHLQVDVDKLKRPKHAHASTRPTRSASAASMSATQDKEPGRVYLAKMERLNRLAIEGVLAVQHSIARRCRTSPGIERSDSFQPEPEENNEVGGEEQVSLPVSPPPELSSELDKEDDLEPWYEGDSLRRRRRGAARDMPDLDFLAVARARTAEVLRQRRIKKQRFALAAEKFNAQPSKLTWMTYAQELGLLEAQPDGKPDPKSIAQFLKNTPGLSKSAIGEFLSKGPPEQHPLNAAVLQQYVETFDFSHMSFDEALRSFLARFRLPGEAQCIDRLMEAFAKRLFDQVGPGNPFANADAAFILAFSTIMLNTDLHNPQIQDSKRMKLEEFIRNNKGINGGADLPTAFLEDLYHKIKAEEIQVQKDLRDVVGMEDADFSRLENLLNGDSQNQLTAASFTPTLTARKHIFPAGIHEKDMFMAFCDGILVTMLKVWTICDDNILLLKILEGIQDYARICAYYKMTDHVNNMAHLLIRQTLFGLEKLGLRVGPHSSIFAGNREQVDLPSTPELLLLLELVESLQTPQPSTTAMDSATAERVLNLVPRLKCPLILYTVLMLCSQHIAVLVDAWRDLVDLILVLRGLHVLPASLLELDDFADARGNPLPPSIFMRQCIEAGAAPHLDDGDQASETQGAPSSGSSILNPLWWLGYQSQEAPASASGRGGGTSASGTAAMGADSFNDDAWLYEPPAANPQAPRTQLPELRDLLRSCLEKCKLDALLFHRTKEVELPAVCILVDSILECVVYMDQATGEIKLCQTCEIDCVLALEWVARIIVANPQRATQLWPHLHSVLDFVLDSRAVYACQHTPYLVERCIITVLRAGIHMLDIPEISARVWESLRLLRAIPVDISRFISDRLGAGLLTLIKVAPHNQSSEEQWYLLFALLGAAASGRPGRPFVWEAISFLIDHNVITDQNFVPARHLVLRFLQGVFPGEDEDDVDSRQPSIDEPSAPASQQESKTGQQRLVQASNPWVTGSLILLQRLMMMILKGLLLLEFESEDDPAFKNAEQSAPQEFQSVEPVILDDAVARVVPIWFDTVKTCAEYTAVSPVEVSKNAAHCLQVLLTSAATIKLSPTVWSHVLGTLFAALPLSVTTASMKPTSFTKAQLELLVVRNCELMLDTFLEHFAELLQLEDFQSVLLRLVSALATNFAASDPRSEVQMRFYDMILVILRRLHNSHTWQLYTSAAASSSITSAATAAPTTEQPSGENTAGPTPQAEQKVGESHSEQQTGHEYKAGTQTTEDRKAGPFTQRMQKHDRGSDGAAAAAPPARHLTEEDRRELFKLVWKVLDSVAPSFRTCAQQRNEELTLPDVQPSAQGVAASETKQQQASSSTSASPWNPTSILASLLDRKAYTV